MGTEDSNYIDNKLNKIIACKAVIFYYWT